MKSLDKDLHNVINELPKEARMKFIEDSVVELVETNSHNKNVNAKPFEIIEEWFDEAENYFLKDLKENIDILAGLKCARGNPEEAISFYENNGDFQSAMDLAKKYKKYSLEFSLMEKDILSKKEKKRYRDMSSSANYFFMRTSGKSCKSLGKENLSKLNERAKNYYSESLALAFPYSFNGNYPDLFFENCSNKHIANVIGDLKHDRFLEDNEKEEIILRMIKKLEDLEKYGILANFSEMNKDWESAAKWYEKTANLNKKIVEENLGDKFDRKKKFNLAGNMFVKAKKISEAVKVYVLAGEYGKAADLEKKEGNKKESLRLYKKAINKGLYEDYVSFPSLADLAKKAGLNKLSEEFIDRELAGKFKSYYLAADLCKKFGRINEAIDYSLKNGNFENASNLEKERGNLEQAKKYKQLEKIKSDLKYGKFLEFL
jgi:hypothetical protein